MPSIISRDIQELIWDTLIRSPDAKITSEYTYIIINCYYLRVLTLAIISELQKKANFILVNNLCCD